MPFEPDRRRTLMGLASLAGAWSCVRCASQRPEVSVPARQVSSTPAPRRAVVARARRPAASDPKTGRVDALAVGEMVESATRAATGDATFAQAFQRRFDASDVVGIKLSALAGRGLSPHPQVAGKIVGGLRAAGVRQENIVLWDRSDDELQQAGFTPNRTGGGVRCLGTNDDYDWTPREWGVSGSCFARILVDELTALVNVAVIKDHDLAGISAGMKNWYGVIHNPNKHHDGGCDPYVAHLAAFPLIRDKLRLTVVDGLVAQCHGGPARSPRWAWAYQGLLVSTDPVAIDAVCWQIIEQRRQQMGLGALADEQRAPKWIATAHGLGLGEGRPEHIRVMDV